MVKKKTNSRISEKTRAPENRRPGFIIQYPSCLRKEPESHEEYSHHQRYRPAMI